MGEWAWGNRLITLDYTGMPGAGKCGILGGVCPKVDLDFARLYAEFEAPITALDCGEKCAPYNERGVPFCCDTRHAVPAAYRREWNYLSASTDLWRLWEGDDAEDVAELQAGTPPGMLLIACRGHQHCQRDFRSLTCRAFPFFPYFNSRGDWLGLSYYWDYEDRCWVISHLRVVSNAYRAQFRRAFERIFAAYPQERAIYAHHSALMRAAFQRRRRAIPLLHCNGGYYKISPGSERMRRVPPDVLPKHGVYRLAAEMPFPDER